MTRLDAIMIAAGLCRIAPHLETLWDAALSGDAVARAALEDAVKERPYRMSDRLWALLKRALGERRTWERGGGTMRFVYDDGGRAAAGFRGRAPGDCVARSIAIATGVPYREVYDALNVLAKRERRGKWKRGVSSSRDGVHKVTYRRYLESIGWSFTPTMSIGSGCTVHLADGELPAGRLVVCVSRHLTAVLDGVIHDTADPQRWTVVTEHGVQRTAGRCVYGYFTEGGRP